MIDDELIERLRRTFHERADGLQPAPGRMPSTAPDLSFGLGLGAGAVATGEGRPDARPVDGGAATPGPADEERRTAEYPTFSPPGPVPINRGKHRRWPPVVAVGALVAAGAAASIAVAVSGGKHPETIQSSHHGPPVSAPTQPAPAPTNTVATPSTVAVPAPTTAPSVPSQPLQAVPAGFQPSSVTFVSAADGWVVSTGGASDDRCFTLARTTDGGRTWYQTGTPPTGSGCTPASTDPIRYTVRFADSSDGWVYSNGSSGLQGILWSTHNGGTTWEQQVPVQGGSIGALEASGGQVQMVDYGPCQAGSADCQGQTVEHILSSPVSTDRWKDSPTSLSIGAGPVLSPAMTLWGTGGWLINDNRTVVSGARLTPTGDWAEWRPPCAQAGGAGLVGASSASDLVAICAEGMWGTPDAGTTAGRNWLFRSYDGGSSFVAVAAAPGNQPQSVTTPPGTLATVVLADGAEGLQATFDGGTTWSTMEPGQGTAGASGALNGGYVFDYVGFTTATQGVAVATDPSPALFMTRDGGHTWSQVSFTG